MTVETAATAPIAAVPTASISVGSGSMYKSLALHRLAQTLAVGFSDCRRIQQLYHHGTGALRLTQHVVDRS